MIRVHLTDGKYVDYDNVVRAEEVSLTGLGGATVAGLLCYDAQDDIVGEFSQVSGYIILPADAETEPGPPN